jgi:hypothetical protein
MTKGSKRVGAWVALKHPVRGGPQKAQIRSEHPKIAKGAVYVSPALDGMRWWNKSDLVVTTPPKTARKSVKKR